MALKPEERQAFLRQACGHDEELRQIVEALLVEDANAGSLLEHPPVALLTQAVVCAGRTVGPLAGSIPSTNFFREREA